MKTRLLLVCTVALAVTLNASAQGRDKVMAQNGPRVKLETSKGTIVLELDAEAAPKTVENFLTYVRKGHYDGTIFHRVIPRFMIQGGGFTPSMEQKPTGKPIRNEAANGLKNLRGTVAMARTSKVDSATAQFFINLVDNPYLDHSDDSASGYGYCVFGRVVEGMDVVDAIAGVPTGVRRVTDPRSGKAVPFRDVPVEPVVILRATVLEDG